MASARLTDQQVALMDALVAVVAQCQNVIEFNARRPAAFPALTLNERQEIAMLRIRLDDLADAQSTARAEAS